MRLKGKKLSAPEPVLIFLPRGEDETIIFKARAVLDMSDFDSLCPRPKPSIRTHKNGTREFIEDSHYKGRLDAWGTKRTAYMILRSLEATEELEWETVDIHRPDTWENYEKEFKESGFSDVEVQRIISGVLEANSLNESKIEEARRSFLAQQSQPNGFTSNQDVLQTIPSGELANDLD
jgi:hypothetical protein